MPEREESQTAQGSFVLISFLNLKSNQQVLTECLLCTKEGTQINRQLRGLSSLNPNTTFQGRALDLKTKQWVPHSTSALGSWNKLFKFSLKFLFLFLFL